MPRHSGPEAPTRQFGRTSLRLASLWSLAVLAGCTSSTGPEPFFPDEPAPDQQPEYVAS
jgi:hypothetical protein